MEEFKTVHCILHVVRIYVETIGKNQKDGLVLPNF